MLYAIEDIARTLKEAREAKGLTQRALSAKVGLTQAHISNIENAAADLHLSNLLELARALDLEVMLVPRKAVPAAQGLIRNIETATWIPSDPGKTVQRLDHSVEKLGTLYPEIKDVERLRSIVALLKKSRLNKQQSRIIQNAARELQRIGDTLQKSRLSDHSASTSEIERISRIANQLREMRNAIVHAVPPENPNRVQPAYRLDDGEADG